MRHATLGAANPPNLRVNCVDSKYGRVAQVVARVATTTNQAHISSSGDQQEQPFVQVRTSIRVQQVAASSTEWHRLDQIPYEF